MDVFHAGLSRVKLVCLEEGTLRPETLLEVALAMSGARCQGAQQASIACESWHRLHSYADYAKLILLASDVEVVGGKDPTRLGRTDNGRPGIGA